MDWLKEHMEEVILPNLRAELIELTGIRLDSSLGEFRFIAEPLDEDEIEDCEEFEITIHLGSLCLVDACFLMEEIESGLLPMCIEEEDLRETLIQAKLKALITRVIPKIHTEMVHEMAINQWNSALANLLQLTPEVLEEVAGRHGSGGYPPMVLVIRHPHFDPDAFEVSVRFDPMAREEWVDWSALMPHLNSALKAIGEEAEEVPPTQVDAKPPPLEEQGPSMEDLQDSELSDLEENAREEAPVRDVGQDEEEAIDLESSSDSATSLFASLEQSLGIKLTLPSSKKPKKD
jgi:hypothetical protein